jgi:hypothetical protein
MVLVDHGPVTMTIEAAYGGKPLTEAALAGSRRVLELLDELTPLLPIARRAVGDIDFQTEQSCPEVLRRMIRAVRLLNEGDFTPMAAVAGAFSELVAESVEEAGAERIIVNNGGDIALRIPLGTNSFQAGIISDIGMGVVTHKIQIAEGEPVRGIATSGLGGRSLTKGVASAVTVLAGSASLSDAAATAVANATNCEDPAIERCLAEEIDYFTDIRGHTVTRRVGALGEGSRREAVVHGLKRAEEIMGRGMITGAVIFVQQELGMLPCHLAQPL